MIYLIGEDPKVFFGSDDLDETVIASAYETDVALMYKQQDDYDSQIRDAYKQKTGVDLKECTDTLNSKMRDSKGRELNKLIIEYDKALDKFNEFVEEGNWSYSNLPTFDYPNLRALGLVDVAYKEIFSGIYKD